MINRYKYRAVVKNDLEIYSEIFKKRGIKLINHFSTPNMTSPEEVNYENIKLVSHIWKEGDRYYKLAEKYYGDPKDWWVIARFNLRPTEAHNQIGDELKIPFPLEKVLNYLRG